MSKQVIKKPNHKVILSMLQELLQLKVDGDCFVPFGREDIEAQIAMLKLHIGSK